MTNIKIDLSEFENNIGIKIEEITFPDGSRKFKIKKLLFDNYFYDVEDSDNVAVTVTIKAALLNYQIIFDLALIKDAVFSYFSSYYTPRFNVKYNLDIEYLMYQQDDRRFSDSESFGLRILSNFINSLKFDRVSINCPHSEMVELFDNYFADDSFFSFYYKVIRQKTHFLNSFKDFEKYVWVIPDAGAYKKQIKIIDKINSENGLNINFVSANKTRDFNTNEIKTQLSVDNLEGRNCIIFDDICLGGNTFINLAKVLKEKGAGKIDLVVPHGVFNQGLEHIYEHIDVIYTSDSICNLEETERLKFIY